jgi:4-amino-4-deoxy-L-arabinose transferase-like glycosyltransferase
MHASAPRPPSARPGRSRAGAALVVLPALALALLWLLAARRLPVYPDEAYYWTWAQRLSARYHDHPPGVALALRGALVLLGDGRLGLRAPAALGLIATLGFSALAAAAAAPTEARRGAAGLAVLVLVGAPMLTIGFLPTTPDPLHAAVTAAAGLAVVRALDGRRGAAGLAAFLLVVAGGLKHYAALVAVGVLVGLLTTAEGRRSLRRPEVALGLGLGLLALSPWLRAELEGPSSIGFQFRRVVFGRPSRWAVAAPLMLGSLLGTLGPAGVLVLGAAARRGLRRGASGQDRALVGGALGLLAGCLLAVGLGSGEANWPLPALVIALPVGIGAALEGRRLALALRWSAVVSVGAMAVALAHVAHPMLPGRAGKDPTARGAGWAELARAAGAAAERAGTRTLVTQRYHSASLLAWHLRDAAPEVLELGTPGGRLSQFDRWPRPALCPGRPLVLVLNAPAWPERLPARPTASSTVVVRRRGDGAELDRWWITAGVVDAEAPPDARCGAAP